MKKERSGTAEGACTFERMMEKELGEKPDAVYHIADMPKGVVVACEEGNEVSPIDLITLLLSALNVNELDRLSMAIRLYVEHENGNCGCHPMNGEMVQ